MSETDDNEEELYPRNRLFSLCTLELFMEDTRGTLKQAREAHKTIVLSTGERLVCDELSEEHEQDDDTKPCWVKVWLDAHIIAIVRREHIVAILVPTGYLPPGAR
jgi:hypothetical protein